MQNETTFETELAVGAALLSIGRYEDAAASFVCAAAVACPRSRQRAIALSNLAAVHFKLGQSAEAKHVLDGLMCVGDRTIWALALRYSTALMWNCR
jgi:hypothetical protein